MRSDKDLIEKLNEAKATLLSLCPDFPKIVIVLGSGLGELTKDMEIDVVIPYSEVPNFKQSTVQGHAGQLVVGTLHGVRVACMQGRLHFYEGHTMEEVVFPHRSFAWAGAKAFVLTNASGGLKKDMSPLDFVLLRDHINLMGTSPLVGKNYEELGPRFPDMTNVYDPKVRKIFLNAAKKLDIPMREGVYVGLHGPTYETPSEIRMYQGFDAHAVGMSTVPEAIALHHMGIRVIGLSCVTNMAAGVTADILDHSDVLANAKKIYSRFSALMKEVIGDMGGAIE